MRFGRGARGGYNTPICGLTGVRGDQTRLTVVARWFWGGGEKGSEEKEQW
jgi:hypothetical protein